MRRDLDLDWEPTRARAQPARPLAAARDVPALRVPQPAGPGRRAGRGGAGGAVRHGRGNGGRRGARASYRRSRAGRAIAADGDRVAVATANGVVVAPKPSNGLLLARRRGSSSTTRSRSRCARASRTRMIAAYLIEPGPGRVRARRPRAPSTASRCCRSRAAEEETAALVRRAEAPRRLIERMLERVRERGSEHLYREIELPLTAVLAAMEDRGRQDRHVSHGRDHGAPRRPGRGAGGEGVRARGRGVHARLDAAGRADPLREARADARAARARPATRPTRASSARSAATTRSCRCSRSGASSRS